MGLNFLADYKKDVQQGERSPDMLITEVEIFKTIRDKNGDLVLDREELASWVMPPEYDHTLNEAKHLIYEADENKVTHNRSSYSGRYFIILIQGRQTEQRRNTGQL